MNIAIIGYGGMATHHVNHYIKGYNERYGETEGRITLTGIYDIDRARIDTARNAGLYIYENADAIFRDAAVDAVLIATPNDVHADYAIRAAQAGKHILCEKPISCRLSEAAAMYKAANAANVKLCVHQNRRWDADYLTVRKIIADGILTGVYRVESRVMGSNGIPGEWRRQKAHGGGMMLDWGVHQVDQVLEMIDSPVKSVYAAFSYIEENEVDDGYRLELTFADGRTAGIETDTNTFVPLPRWQVYGFDGTAVIRDWALNGEVVVVQKRVDETLTSIPAGNGFTKTMATRNASTVERRPLPKVESDAFALYRNFIRACKGIEPLLVQEGQVLRVFAVMEAAFRSFETGTVVQMDI